MLTVNEMKNVLHSSLTLELIITDTVSVSVFNMGHPLTWKNTICSTLP